jgi:hypothetical protein
MLQAAVWMVSPQQCMFAARRDIRRPTARSSAGTRTLKNRVLLENYYLPGDLEACIGRFVVL